MLNKTASGKERLYARLLDTFIELLFFSPLIFWYFRLPEDGSILPIVGVMTLIVIILESVVPIILKGRTIGKKIMGLRMVSLYGGKASKDELTDKGFIYMLIPIMLFTPILNGVFLVMIIYFNIISLIFIFFDSKNQGVIDKLTSIIVIRDDKLLDNKIDYTPVYF